MALKNKYIKEDGEILSGYYRISQISTQYEKSKDLAADEDIYFDVQVYNDATNEKIVRQQKSVREANEIKSHSLDAQGQPVSGLIIKAYEQLKTLDHFSDAIDC